MSSRICVSILVNLEKASDMTSEINDLIVERIKKAREDLGLKQHHLAERLNRTPAAISELERGKVQINAADLYELAQLFEMPISYFYGEDYEDPREGKLISYLRQVPEEVRQKAISFITVTLEIQLKTEQYKKAMDGGEQEKIKAVRDYYNTTGKYLATLEELKEQSLRLKRKFEEHFGYVLEE